jgi:hypothetical protein
MQHSSQPQVMAHQHVAYQPQSPMQQSHLAVQQQSNVLRSIDWASRIANVMKSQFGLKSKEPTYIYRKPHPEAYDQVAMPHRYRVPDFNKFSGQNNVTTVEHISRFLVQCGEVSRNDALNSFFPVVSFWISILPNFLLF